MKKFCCNVALLLAVSFNAALAALPAPPVTQAPSPDFRNATREKLRAVLATGGTRKDVNVAFRQSDKNPYNFIGSMRDGLRNSENLEIVVNVTKSDTIGFRVYPHYAGGYINLAKVKDRAGLMRRLLYLSDQNFLFWGADDSGDVFCGYTISLESGFPDDVIITVLRSIRYADKIVGDLRPFIDDSVAAP